MSTVTVVPAPARARREDGGRHADPLDVGGRRLLSVLGQVQADRGGLDRDLRPAVLAEPARLQPAQQRYVLVGDGGGMVLAGGVLAQVVEADRQPAGLEPA